jgi:predicted DNA binding protein/PAS domain-containing protein
MGTARTDAAGRDGVALRENDYRAIRRCAETYRESLFVRLCGEVGLRPAEICRITPASFSRQSTRNARHHLLALSGGDGDGDERTAYVPADVRSAVERYVNEQAVGDDEPVFDLTPRRVQMIVSEVSDRAAEAAGDSRLDDVSSRDLRRYYGRRLLHGEGVDPCVVMAVGGWDHLDGLLRDTGTVDAGAVIGALEETSLANGPGRVSGCDVERAVDQAGSGVLVTDPEGRIEYANDGFAALTRRTLDDLVGRDAAVTYAAEDDARAHARAGPHDDSWVRLGRADGGEVRAVRSATAVIDDRGAPVGTVAVFVRPDGRAAGAAEASTARSSDRLADAIASLRSVNEVLPAADDRGEAERRVCERLAANDAYRFALVTGASGDRHVEPRTWAGVDDDAAKALVSVTARLEEPPGQTAIATDEVEVRTEVPDDADGRLDRLRETVGSLAFVPLTYGDTTHGLLVLGSEASAAFDGEEREVLAGLGWQVGQAVTDIERKKLLLADSVLELEFRVRDEDAFLIEASRQFDATFELEGLVPGEGQSLLCFVTMTGASPDEVLTYAADVDDVENARLIRDYGEGYLLEFSVGGEEPATTLTELGGHVNEFVVENGAQRIEAEFTAKTDVRAVLSGLESSYRTAELLSKQEVERSVQTADGFRRSLEDDLTDKQQSVLTAAYHAAYFEWPRGSTAEELADSIGVSSPTLHNHLRKAQQKLLTAYFDEAEG